MQSYAQEMGIHQLSNYWNWRDRHASNHNDSAVWLDLPTLPTSERLVGGAL